LPRDLHFPRVTRNSLPLTARLFSPTSLHPTSAITPQKPRPLSSATTEDIELTELYNTQGYKAWDRRAREHQRSADRKKQRKLYRANYERYAAEAKLKNIQRAAEKLIAEKLAADKAASQSAQPVPQGLDDTTASAATRKPPTSIDKGSLEAQPADREAPSPSPK
jgi:hypothetical protein